MASRGAALLDAWEQIHPCRKQPEERDISILFAAGELSSGSSTDQPREHVLAIDLDDATRRLLDGYETAFGRRFEAVADCPRCHQAVQMSFTTDDVRRALGAPAGCSTMSISLNGFDVCVRMLTAGDLAAAARHGELQSVQSALLERAIVRATWLGHSVDAGALPEAVVARLSEQLEQAQPAADPRVALLCSGCGERWH